MSDPQSQKSHCKFRFLPRRTSQLKIQIVWMSKTSFCKTRTDICIIVCGESKKTYWTHRNTCFHIKSCFCTENILKNKSNTYIPIVPIVPSVDGVVASIGGMADQGVGRECFLSRCICRRGSSQLDRRSCGRARANTEAPQRD